MSRSGEADYSGVSAPVRQKDNKYRKGTALHIVLYLGTGTHGSV